MKMSVWHVLAVGAMLGAIGCKGVGGPGPQVRRAIPPELVGTWRATGRVPPSKPRGGGMRWMKEYSFQADGTFRMSGYPPLRVNGKAQVVGRTERRFLLKLTERSMGGSRWPDQDVRAELSPDRRKLRWQGRTTFHKR